jgi:tRNA G18 (ribose-2'-O)-methylase SpoU
MVEQYDEPKLVGGQTLKYNVITCLQNNNDLAKKVAKSFFVPLEIAVQNIKFTNNTAMIARTLACLGIPKLHLLNDKACDWRPAVGSRNYIDIVKPGKIDPSTYFQENDLIPILIEQGGISLEDFNFKTYIREGKKICLVMGNEATGLSSEYLKQKFPIVSISQYGVLRSLNVQVAASIVMYEFTKQWRQIELSKI